MKNTSAFFTYAACGFLFTALLSGQVAKPTAAGDHPLPLTSATDLAWLEVRAAFFTPDFPAQLPTEPAARRAALENRAVVYVRAADRAKAFYTEHPDHEKAHEAKLAEVRALVAANQAGDATIDGRLSSTLTSLRADQTVSASIRVQAVSACLFPKAMRGAKNSVDRLAAAANVARGLAVEFPDQPQGTESLVTIAAASDEGVARQLASEVLAMPAPTAIKQRAQALLDRFALVGKPLAGELDGADLGSIKATVVANRPSIIYTWATWSPGSLRLAAELKKSNPAANIIGLNLDHDTTAAEALAQKEELVGSLVYDDRGIGGALAQRLKVYSAPQVVLVDAQGIIRDMRGESGMQQKLQSLGF